MGGKAGILRDKTKADKFMNPPNYDTQNLLVCRLKWVVETFGHSTYHLKVPKVSKSTKKNVIINFGD